MDPAEIGFAISGVIFASLLVVIHIHRSCDKLKNRADNLLKAKMDLVDCGFLDFIHKISKGRKKKLSPEDRESLTNLSFIAFDLKRLLKNSISHMKDKISSSFLLGFAFGIIAPFMGVIYEYNTILAFFAGYLAVFIGYLYVEHSFYQFIQMRKMYG